VKGVSARAASGLRLYAGVMTNRHLSATLIGAMVARLAQTMSPLVILLLLNDRYGGFAVAGAASAAYGLCGSVTGPFTARLAERRGTFLLLVAGLVSTAGLLVILLPWQPWCLWAGVLLAGSAIPPMGATLRATIAGTLDRPEERLAAYGLDTISTEVLFVLGPAAVGLLVVVGGPATALTATAVLPSLGAAIVLGSEHRTAGASAPRATAGRSRSRGMLARLAPWLAVAAAQMAAIGLVEVAVIAIAIDLRSSAVSGAVLAIWAAGSVVGGLWFGSRSSTAPAHRQLRLLLVASAVGFVLLLGARSMPLLCVFAFTAGLALSPAAAALLAGLTEVLPPDRRMTGFAWLASANGVSGALAYAVAGLLVGATGPWITIAIAATLPVAATMLVRAPRPAAGDVNDRHDAQEPS
jgi:MFS family permease